MSPTNDFNFTLPAGPQSNGFMDRRAHSTSRITKPSSRNTSPRTRSNLAKAFRNAHHPYLHSSPLSTRSSYHASPSTIDVGNSFYIDGLQQSAQSSPAGAWQQPNVVPLQYFSRGSITTIYDFGHFIDCMGNAIEYSCCSQLTSPAIPAPETSYQYFDPLAGYPTTALPHDQPSTTPDYSGTPDAQPSVVSSYADFDPASAGPLVDEPELVGLGLYSDEAPSTSNRSPGFGLFDSVPSIKRKSLVLEEGWQPASSNHDLALNLSIDDQAGGSFSSLHGDSGNLTAAASSLADESLFEFEFDPIANFDCGLMEDGLIQGQRSGKEIGEAFIVTDSNEIVFDSMPWNFSGERYLA